MLSVKKNTYIGKKMDNYTVTICDVNLPLGVHTSKQKNAESLVNDILCYKIVLQYNLVTSGTTYDVKCTS